MILFCNQIDRSSQKENIRAIKIYDDGIRNDSIVFRKKKERKKKKEKEKKERRSKNDF